MSMGGHFNATVWVFTALLLVLLSAVKLVNVQYQQRVLFADLSRQEQRRDALLEEWSRLQIELSILSSHDHIRSTAMARLDMYIPAPRDFILIGP